MKFLTLSVLAGAALTSAAPTKKVECTKAFEGSLVMTSTTHSDRPNLHVHQSSPADNGYGMLSMAEKETWAEFWECKGFAGHNPKNNKNFEKYGQVRIADDWCLERVKGTGPVSQGLVLQHCTTDAGDKLNKQWFKADVGSKKVHMIAPVDLDGGKYTEFGEVVTHRDYHFSLEFKPGLPNGNEMAIEL